MVQLEPKRSEMELKIQGCFGEQWVKMGTRRLAHRPHLPCPLEQPWGMQAAGLRCLALVYIRGKKKTRALLSSLDRSRWLCGSHEHGLAGVHGTRAAMSATSSLLAWLSSASRSGLKTCFVQHWLIPAPAHPENPPARTQTQETSWDWCQNPSGGAGRGHARSYKVRQGQRWKQSNWGRMGGHWTALLWLERAAGQGGISAPQSHPCIQPEEDAVWDVLSPISLQLPSHPALLICS